MAYDHQAEFARTYGFSAPAELKYFGFFAPQTNRFYAHCDEVFSRFFLAPLELKSEISFSDEFISGQIYIQDYASFEAARIFCSLILRYLRPCAKEQNLALKILDICAAPGGKTNAIFHLLNQPRFWGELCSRDFGVSNPHDFGVSPISFELAANEANTKRFHLLKRQLALLGVAAKTYNHDGVKIGRKCPNRFDAILLDAPCSCNAHDFGVYKSPKEIKQIALLQKRLLHSALLALRPGGVLLYSTCSYNRAENEEVIANALNSKLACKMLAISSNLEHFTSDFGSLRILPSAKNSGFFIAALQKKEENENI